MASEKLSRTEEIAAAAPLIARAMRAQMVVNLHLGGFCDAGECLDSIKELGWPGLSKCTIGEWIDDITAQALKECQRLEIK